MTDTTITPPPSAFDDTPYIRPRRAVRPIFDTRPKRIWLISFTDFMSLMVSFFVMLYAMSEPNLGEYKKVADAMTSQFSNIEKIEKKPYTAPPLSTGESAVVTLPRKYQNSALDVRYLREVVIQRKSLIPALDAIDVQTDGNDVVVALPWTPGVTSADPHIDGLSQLIDGIPNQVHLVVDQAVATDAGAAAALMSAQQIASGFRAAGYKRPLFILVNPGATKAPTWSLKITPFTE